MVELVSEDNKHQQAWASLAMLIGGVTLVWAVVDSELSDEIANAIINKIPLL